MRLEKFCNKPSAARLPPKRSRGVVPLEVGHYRLNSLIRRDVCAFEFGEANQ